MTTATWTFTFANGRDAVEVHDAKNAADYVAYFDAKGIAYTLDTPANDAETAIMNALMDAPDALTTAQVTAAGQQMTTARRRKLVDAGMIRVYRVGRGYLHEITDEGAVMVKATRATTVVDTETRIRTAYAAQGARTVKLADLRALVDAPRAEFDAALARMATMPGVHVRSEADQKTLTDQDRAAALMLAGTDRHTLLIEKTRTVSVLKLPIGARITNIGTAYEGATVAAAPVERFENGHAWISVPLADGRTMDLDAWDAPVTIIA